MGRRSLVFEACAEGSGASGQQNNNGECRVCGAAGAMPHYGSISCNGCRTFFRRSIWGEKNYKCAWDGNCYVAHGNRRRCRSCRLARCRLEGMNSMLVECNRDKQYAPLPATRSVVSARELMRKQAMRNEEFVEEEEEASEIEDDGTGRETTRRSPMALRLFPHASLVTNLLDQQHWAEQLGTNGTGHGGSDDGRLFRADLSFNAVLRDPGIAVARAPISWEARRLVQPSDVPFILTRAIVLTTDWATLLNDFYALSMSDRQTLLHARGTMISFITCGFNSFVRGGGENLLMLDGTFYPRCPRLQEELPFSINHFLKGAAAAFDELFTSMRENDFDNGEMAVLKALTLFMSTPKMSPEGRRHVEQTRLRYVDALYAHIRQRRPELSERKVAMRIAKILLLLPLAKRVAHEQDITIQSLALCNVIDNLHGTLYEVHAPDTTAYE